MCKIVALTDASKVKDIQKLVNIVAKHVSATERDGFGWTASGTKGLFGERSINPKFRFRMHLNSQAVKLPIIKPLYDFRGEVSKLNGGVIFHGRTSTNDKNIGNTHPLQKNGFTLIHNGVVQNKGPEYQMETTNDTEHLVHYLSTEGIQGIEANLTGYYAFAAFDPEGNLHFCRDDKATLFIAKVEALDTYIIATTQELIQKICKDLKVKPGPIDMLKDNYYFVMRGNTLVSQQDIKPRGVEYDQSKYMSRSLSNLSSADLSRYSTGYSTESLIEQSEVTETSAIDSVESAESVADALEAWPAELDLEGFLRQVKREVGGGYEIYFFEQQISPYDFLKLSEDKMLECEIYRPDGTELTPWNYKAS